jgi:hypothetical protein
MLYGVVFNGYLLKLLNNTILIHHITYQNNSKRITARYRSAILEYISFCLLIII